MYLMKSIFPPPICCGEKKIERDFDEKLIHREEEGGRRRRKRKNLGILRITVGDQTIGIKFVICFRIKHILVLASSQPRLNFGARLGIRACTCTSVRIEARTRRHQPQRTTDRSGFTVSIRNAFRVPLRNVREIVTVIGALAFETVSLRVVIRHFLFLFVYVLEDFEFLESRKICPPPLFLCMTQVWRHNAFGQQTRAKKNFFRLVSYIF
jgi:hypothetical protein